MLEFAVLLCAMLPEILSAPKSFPSHEPYILHVPGRMAAIGLAHFNDPDSPQFAIATAAWETVVNEIGSDSIVALTEGQSRIMQVQGLSPENALRKEGDPGLHTRLALNHSVEVISGEPDVSWVDNKLIERFGHKETALATYIRFGAQYLRGIDEGQIPETTSYDEYVASRERYQKSLKNPDLAPWLAKDALNDIWSRLYPGCGPLDPAAPATLPNGEARNTEFYVLINRAVLRDNTRNPGKLADLTEAFGQLRDIFLAQRIGKLYAADRYPVVAFSNYHAAFLREAAPDQVDANKDGVPIARLMGLRACQEYFRVQTTSL